MRKIFNNSILYQTFLIFIIVLFFIAGNVKYSFSQVLWQQTNGPLGGNVPSLAINNTSGAIFAGGEAGVFRSDNNGDSWTSISTGLPTEPILNIAINSSGHIFTGSFMGSLHRSMDNGATWELKNNGLPPDFEIMTMVINSTDSIFVASFNGIYRSADNGENWSLSTTGLPYPEMNVLYVAPNGNVLGGNFNGVYETADDGDNWRLLAGGVSVNTMVVNSDGDIFVSSGNGVKRLSIGQQLWDDVNTGLPQPPDITKLAINSNGTLFAGTFAGLYRSTNKGDSWTAVNTGLTSTDINTIIFNTTGTSFTGTRGGIFSSTDNGDNWTRKINGLLNSTVKVMETDPNGNFYAGTISGLFRSIDTGTNWTEITALTGKDVKFIIINSTGNIFVGTEKSGVYRSLDDGVTWTQANTGLTGTEIRAMTINAADELFVSAFDNVMYSDSLYRSINNADSWTAINGTLTEPLALAVDSDGDMFASTWSGIQRSTDNGVNWNTANPDLTGATFLKIRSDGYMFAEIFNNFNFDNGILMSVNKGMTWIEKNNGLTDSLVQTFYISRKGHLFAGTHTGGLFRSTDLGDNWVAANNGLTNPNLHALAMNNGGDFLAGTIGSGVFRSQYDNSIHSVSPTSLNFGNVRTTTTKTDSVFVTNTGFADLNVGPFSLTGTNAAEFNVTSSPFVLAPGQSRGVQINFTPINRITHSASLEISTSGGSTNIPLAGTGIAPVLSLLMTTFDVGNVRINTTQQIDSLYLVANDGDDTLFVNSAGFSGTDAVNFNVTDHVDFIAPAEDGWFSFSFTPDRTGMFTALLTIDSDGGSGDVTITGTGSAPVLQVIPQAIDFGQVGLAASATDTLLIKNTGDDVLNVDMISVSGTNAANFSVLTTPFSVDPGDSTKLPVTFTPNVAGTYSAQINIQSNGGSAQIALSGNGSEAILLIVPTALDFGPVAVNTSKSDSVIVENTGSSELTINSIDIGGTNPANFTTNTSTFTLPAGGSQVLPVIFTPNVTGNFSATLNITSNGGNATVTLTGTGTQPVLTTDPQTINFGQVQAGTSRAEPLTITNTGTGNLIIGSVVLDGPNFAEFSVAGSTTDLPSLPPLSTLNLTINFIPASQGNKSAYLIFTSNSVTNPDTVILSGTGSQSYSVNVSHEQATAGNALTISFTLSNSFRATTQTLYYRNAGKIEFLSTDLMGTDTNYTGVIPAEYVNIRGIEYYIYLSDGNTLITYPSTDPQIWPMTARVLYKQYKPPISFTAMKYKMISFPCEVLVPTAESVFFDDYGPYDKREWRLSYYYPSATSYFVEYPFPADFEPGPGMAFWLITRNGNIFDIEDILSIFSNDSTYITLRPGWNQVGCPFAFPVSIYDMIATGELDYPVYYDNTINDYRYDITVLQPWEGYYVYNRSPFPVTIAVPPIEAHGTLLKNNTPYSIKNSQEYVLQLSARIPDTEYQDSQNYLGMLTNAKKNLDKLDFFEAPPIGDFIQLSIIEDEKRFAGNFKPVSPDGQKWNLTLNSTFSVSKNIHINLIETGVLNDSLNVYILDKDYNTIIPVKDGGFDINIKNERTTRHLSVIIGTKSYAQNNNDGIPLVPYAYNLEQNYPNPFNPETIIRYQLARQGYVKLEVFNTLGHKIRILVDGVQNTGEHIAVWNGLNDAGTRVAGGLYFYRLTTNDFNTTKKMILIR